MDPRLTDVLMKKPRPADAADEADERARIGELTKARGEHMALTEFLRSSAWVVLAQKLEDDEWDILRKMELSVDPTTLAKLAGSLLACKAHQVWPERRLAELTEFLSSEQ